MLLGSALVLLLGLSGTISGGRHRRKDLIRLRRNIINDKCPYPCTCPTKEVCDECEECPRQFGEPCSEDRPCDRYKGLVCTFLHDGDTEGICRAETNGLPCIVYNRTYRHGETFSPDCRTQCACQNGTYGCSSLCPQEHISPEGSCRHPRLVELPGQCCREWMCDSQAVEEPPSCEPTFTKWSDCSSNCGSGISTRRSNLNERCEPNVEARICQTRRCDANELFTHKTHHHHLRRGHECKATHRLGVGVHLRFGPCVSKKRYRPKFCGECDNPGASCHPLLSTTVRVDFVCSTPTPELDEEMNVDELLPEFLEPGRDLWTDEVPADDGILLSASVQWVLKCSCEVSPNALLHRVHRTAGNH